MPQVLSRVFMAGLLLLGGSAVAQAKNAPVKPAPGNALWTMVQKQCLPNYRKHHTPKPCTMVVPRPGRHGPDLGFAVIRDKQTRAQYLVLPLTKMSGIEDPKLLAKEHANYFASAWVLGGFMFHHHAGKKATADYTSVAVNSAYARSQTQLTLHVDCLSAKAHADLAKIAPRLSAKWSKTPYSIAGVPFHVMYLKTKGVARVQPFQMLAQHMPGARQHMADWGVVLTGAPEGGFYLLATKANPKKQGPARGGFAGAVQDHSCRIP